MRFIVTVCGLFGRSTAVYAKPLIFQGYVTKSAKLLISHNPLFLYGVVKTARLHVHLTGHGH